MFHEDYTLQEVSANHPQARHFRFGSFASLADFPVLGRRRHLLGRTARDIGVAGEL
jgi:hypothetical protein